MALEVSTHYVGSVLCFTPPEYVLPVRRDKFFPRGLNFETKENKKWQQLDP